MNINLTDIIAVKASNDIEISAVYLQNNVKVWEADNEPADPDLTPEWYGKNENTDWTQEYFNILPLSNGTVTFNLAGDNNLFTSSTGNGTDWVECEYTPTSQGSTVTVKCKKLQAIYFHSTKFTFNQNNQIRYGTCDYYVRGNLDNSFSTSNISFYRFFMENTHIIGASCLKLALGTQGYSYAYSEPFGQLFLGCTKLRTSPTILPMTTLRQYQYRQMFQGCTSLVTTPILPATSLTVAAYQGMFAGCTSLTTPPALPATSLNILCYGPMFSGCTSLTTAPELPATTLVTNCYVQMFQGCTSLTTAPALPATTLQQGCYTEMFKNCTSLISTPELPATTLLNDCYKGMFNGSSLVNYIKALFTTTPSDTYSQNWTNNVAATGIFVKNIDATWTTTGASGVPTGWTVIYYDTTTGKYYLSDKTTECDDHGNPIAHNYANDPFTIVAKSDGDIVFNRGYYEIREEEGSGSGSGDGEGGDVTYYYEIEYSTDGGTTWETADPTTPELTISVETGDEILMKYDMGLIIDNPDANWEPLIGDGFSQSTADFDVQGNIMSLICSDSFIGETSFPSPGINFYGMFQDCQTLLNAENLILPATTLTSGCYESMFSGCTALTKAPVLPATTLTDRCYSDMFADCTSLTTAPTLPATTLVNYCYTGMFMGCSNLNYIKMLATVLTAGYMMHFSNWVLDVAATGTFVKASSMNSLPTGASGIPSEWTVQDAT